MMRIVLSILVALVGAASVPVSAPAQTMSAGTSDQDISDARIDLLGCLLVTRQQQLDFKEGFKWNELVHRKPGAAHWPDPNLDVAYSGAWADAPEGNWLPTPKGTKYRLTSRFYRPTEGVANGTYYPPPLIKRWRDRRHAHVTS